MEEDNTEYYANQLVFATILKEVFPEVFEELITDFKLIHTGYNSLHDFLENQINDN